MELNNLRGFQESAPMERDGERNFAVFCNLEFQRGGNERVIW